MKKLGFTQTDIRKFTRANNSIFYKCLAASGVERRTKYLAGAGKPIWVPFTRKETARIIREIRRYQGADRLRRAGIR